MNKTDQTMRDYLILQDINALSPKRAITPVQMLQSKYRDNMIIATSCLVIQQNMNKIYQKMRD